MTRLWPGGIRTLVSPSSTSTPSRSNAARIERKSRGSMSSTVTSPPVTAASPMKLAASMCSAPMRCSPPESSVDTLDAQHVRADPLDLRAERDEEAAEVLHVRLAGRVHQGGLALGERGGHDGVLGAHHARLVEKDVLADELVGAKLEPAPDRDLGAELLERVDVGVERPAADEVAAGRREQDVAVAREQRAGEQERAADAVGELLVDLGLRDAGGLDANLVLAEPLDVGAEVGEQREHRVDVADPRDVAQHARARR